MKTKQKNLALLAGAGDYKSAPAEQDTREFTIFEVLIYK